MWIKVVGILVAGATIAAATALFLPLRLRITFRRDREENFLAVVLILVAGISITVFRVPRRSSRPGLAKRQVKIPWRGRAPGRGRVPGRGRPGRAFLRLKRATMAFLKEAFLAQRHECQKLDLVIRLGAGDPAVTALLSGASWAIAGPVLAFLQNYLYFTSRPRIKIIPAFDGYRLQALADCIVKVNPGYIILRSLIKRLSRSLKRGMTARGRASHRRPDEDRYAEHQGNG
ncbi:MAG TPA: DUF2953 domain-containing protein [Firmicutes bacterium]|nr:DUF2953 domain-containing protein [Bacillota bacterium]